MVRITPVRPTAVRLRRWSGAFAHTTARWCFKASGTFGDEMYAKIDKVVAYMEASGPEPMTVAILEDESDSYRVYGTTTIGGNIAEAVGAEDLIAADPDKIFMIWYEGWITPEEAVASIVDNPAFASLKAVQNGDVYALNLMQVYCPGLHMMDVIQTFGAGLYPDLYE